MKLSRPAPADTKASLKANTLKEMIDPQKDVLKKDSNKDSNAHGAQLPHPVTPPPKNVAFEEFKAERGNEIYRIWQENRGTI